MPHLKSDASTLGMSGTGRLSPIQGGRTSPAAVPALTLLYHPDLRRVGDRALLSELPLGREALLGRYQPELVAPDAARGRAAGRPPHQPPSPCACGRRLRAGIVLAAGREPDARRR